MRILHTADWHLGKHLGNFSRLEEQREVLEEICAIADEERVDVVIIAGDLFDNANPSAEAKHLFYKTVKKLTANGTRPVVAIAGNHDSAERIEEPDPLARECGIIFVGHPDTKVEEYCQESEVVVERSDAGFMELQLPQCTYPLRIILAPYSNELRLKKFLGVTDDGRELRAYLQQQWQTLADTYCDEEGVNVMVAHLFFMNEAGVKPEESEDEKPIVFVGGAQAIYPHNIPDAIQYTALGHIHRCQEISDTSGPIVYSGSPLAYSFAEAGQEKCVCLVDLEPRAKASIVLRKLHSGKRLERKRFTSVSEAVSWLEDNQEALVELTICTDTFLTAAEKQSLLSAHSGIISIIPEVTSVNVLRETGAPIDLALSMEDLFTQYFKSAHNGQEPSEEIIHLFREIRALN
jgi:DNA repair protein SbcD/Mre11